MLLPSPRRSRTTAAAVLLLSLAACGSGPDIGPVDVDVIGTKAQFTQPLRNGSNAMGQAMLGATAQGLVTFDATGALIGGLAERWIVEDDGQSYIFRLGRARWTNGKPVKAGEVSQLLNARFKANPALLAGLDPDVRSMTDEVIEIRLPGPTPSFLQILAHPAMAVARPAGGTGPFRKIIKNGVARMTIVDPIVSAGETDNGQAPGLASLPIYVRPVRPALGFARFNARLADLVLGGRFQHLPFVTIANPPNGTIRADPVNGLLGLVIEGKSDFLANRDVREILSSAVDRDHIQQILNLAGWRTVTTIVPDTLDMGRAPTMPSWNGQDLTLRRGYAASIVRNWTQLHEAPPTLRIALPEGPGARQLYRALQSDYAAIGLTTRLVAWDSPADMRLIDEVAPFDSALWYLARLGCDLNTLCSTDAEGRLDAARKAATEQERAIALGEAEILTLAEANYIPLGMPIRFSLVRNRFTGFQPSPRGRHPLNALFRDTR